MKFDMAEILVISWPSPPNALTDRPRHFEGQAGRKRRTKINSLEGFFLLHFLISKPQASLTAMRYRNSRLGRLLQWHWSSDQLRVFFQQSSTVSVVYSGVSLKEAADPTLTKRISCLGFVCSISFVKRLTSTCLARQTSVLARPLGSARRLASLAFDSSLGQKNSLRNFQDTSNDYQ